MRTRELGGGRDLRRPVIDTDRLIEDADAGLAGEFELDGLRLAGAWTEARGRGTIVESVLTEVDLTGSVLGPLTLVDVQGEQVELSNTTLRRVTARRVELVRCRAVGMRLDLELAADVYFEGCRLDYATVRVEQAKGRIVFHECTFREATIGGDLTGAVFAHCDLAGVEFTATAAAGCDLCSSRLDGARGLLSLRGAQVSTDQVLAVADRLAAEAGFRVIG